MIPGTIGAPGKKRIFWRGKTSSWQERTDEGTHPKQKAACFIQRIGRDHVDWEAEKETLTPWQAEWIALLKAIRNDTPHNEAKRAAESNLVDMMGNSHI